MSSDESRQLFGWDEKKQVENFASQWRLDEARIITYAGDDVGWLNVIGKCSS